MKSNIEFEYLYRDASNYKFWNSVIFTDPSSMNLYEIEERIRLSFFDKDLFIAHQIRVPETFPFLNGEVTEEDHCFHEFASIRFTSEIPNDRYGRIFAAFASEIEDASRCGWRSFDPSYLVH